MVTFANEYLVSKNSRDRFFRWQEDLMRAESRAKDTRLHPRTRQPWPLADTWNERQTDSPYAGTPLPETAAMQEVNLFSAPARAPGLSFAAVARSSLRTSTPRMPLAPTTLPDTNNSGLCSARPGNGEQHVDAMSARKDGMVEGGLLAGIRNVEEGLEAYRDGLAPPQRFSEASDAVPSNVDVFPRGIKRPLDALSAGGEGLDGLGAKRSLYSAVDNEDRVTDTIGAIAIDERDLIAAGSSSGGIGTAVMPCADEDEEGVTVAAVTSGTGEHMAMTMASQRCAKKIYRGTRRGPRGVDVADDDEDAIMESFIADFMNHPGVKNCYSAGAIGVMVIKKCRTGYYLYFAHNTDSFALASMGGLEKEPRCTMSRLPEGSKIVKGGRKIRLT